MSRWVWIVGMTLLIVSIHVMSQYVVSNLSAQIIAGAIGLGWYVSHNSTSHNAPTAIGGSANEKALTTTDVSSAATVAGAVATSTVLHVSPTRTVARRDDEPIPTPLALYPIEARSPGSHHVHIAQHHRQGRRTLLNRTSH